MTLQGLMDWLAQFQGWTVWGWERSESSAPAGWRVRSSPPQSASRGAPVFWFSSMVPCVMIRRSMFLSVASDR